MATNKFFKTYPVFAQQGYSNPRAANGKLACANCHLNQKAIEIEAPQAVLPNAVFEVEVKVPYDTSRQQIGANVVGPIAGKKHQELIFPVVAPDPEKNSDVKYLTYPMYAGGNRGRGQVYPTGEKSNMNSFGASQAGQISEITTTEKNESNITIVNSNGTTTSQMVPTGLILTVKQGDVVKAEQALNIDPNVGGFGQEEVELKKQFEKVQAAELNF
eukprot:scaffold11076_cov5385-Chaetoceros_neogracile.AAC.10